MPNSNSSTRNPPSNRPTLPWLLVKPLTLIPARIHSTALTIALNQIFSAAIKAGDLNFLQGRVLSIKIRDAGIDFRLSFNCRQFRSLSKAHTPDLAIIGTVYDFLLLATRTEDPDTLFFKRQLRLDGNAELGLYVKNFLDALEWDPEQLPLPLRFAIRQSVPLYEKLGSIFPSTNHHSL